MPFGYFIPHISQILRPCQILYFVFLLSTVLTTRCYLTLFIVVSVYNLLICKSLFVLNFSQSYRLLSIM